MHIKYDCDCRVNYLRAHNKYKIKRKWQKATQYTHISKQILSSYGFNRHIGSTNFTFTLINKSFNPSSIYIYKYTFYILPKIPPNNHHTKWYQIYCARRCSSLLCKTLNHKTPFATSQISECTICFKNADMFRKKHNNLFIQHNIYNNIYRLSRWCQIQD